MSNDRSVCPNCEQSLSGGEQYCIKCGHPLSEERCPDCDTELDGDETFCPTCGYTLQPDAASSADSHQATTTQENTDDRLGRRRAVLGVLGVGIAGVAGAWLGLSQLRNETQASAATTSATTTPPSDPTAAGQASTQTDPDSTPADSAATSQPLTVTSEWPQFQYDHHNSGHHPDTTGPTELIEEAWTFTRQTTVPDHRDRDDGGEWTPFIPVVAGGSVYISSQDDTIYAIDAATGTEQWRFHTDTRTTDSSRKCTLAVADGTVYGEGPGGQFYALDAETGDPKWRRPEVLDASHIQPTVDGDTVYYEGAPGVVAVNAADGSIEWARDDLGWTVTTAVGSIQVFAAQHGPSDQRLYALDKVSGETRWSVDGPAHACAVVDGVVFTTGAGDSETTDGPPALFAIDAADGTVRWRSDLTAETTGFHPPTVAEGMVYVGGKDGTVGAFDATTGEAVWRYPTTDGAVKGSPVVVDGHVYFATGWEGTVYCVSADDGARKWSHQVGEITYTPTVVDNVVFVGDHQGRVHALAESE